MFFKGLARLENGHASELHKLASPLVEAYRWDYNKGKLGYVDQVPSTNNSLSSVNRSFATAWKNVLEHYETEAENKTRFARDMDKISVGLTKVVKEVESSREQVRHFCYNPCATHEWQGF